MLLSELAGDFRWRGPDVEIRGLARDSREVESGHLFAALPGATGDGRSYIGDAVRRGAVAILAPSGTPVPGNLPAIFSHGPRQALARIAARFYPVQPDLLAAVTGTSGKTSVVQFTRQIWQACGHKSAAIGTLGIMGDGIERHGSLTTPDCIRLHRDLQTLAREKGITHVAVEASSHGLDQFRLDGLRLKLAAFTNLGRDHLDYHPTMEHYFAAKARLFKELLPEDGVAVLRHGIPEYESLAAILNRRGIRIISFGAHDGDLCLRGAKETPEGQELDLDIFGARIKCPVRLAGNFQGLNLLCAAGLALAGGQAVKKVTAALPGIKGVRGRMELVGAHKGARVYVDYAHKPDALENALSALRPSAPGRLAVVFGCGGGRDAGKRSMMGSIGARLADIVVVTDDNPRMEEPASIRRAIMQGCKGATEIAGRGEAIAHALSLLKPGDALVIAGKGHEQGQILGDAVLPFDDADMARKLMQEQAA